MEKYNLIPEQLIYEGSLTESHLFTPGEPAHSHLLLTHTSDYLNQLLDQNLDPGIARRIGFPQSEALIKREWQIAQGTLECAYYAIESGLSFNVAGGTHHAFTNEGEGFCMLNDIAVAANVLLTKRLAEKILVIDLDVHQGNGTAKIFEKNSSVFTLSVHGQNNFPLRKEKSDFDLGLPDGTDDSTYLGLLDLHLKRLLDHVQPDFIFYQSGVDILETDRLGRLSISRQGCLSRDKLVFELCHKNQIPLVVVMGGGYSPDIRDVVEAHCNTFRAGLQLFG
jgi:acetoin utilization deacetylase AcuC-like enzyme